MMKLLKYIIFSAIVISFVLSVPQHEAVASTQPRIEANFWGQIEEKWETVKKKAVEYYNRYFGEQKEKVAQNPNQRTPSSESFSSVDTAPLIQSLPVYTNPQVQEQTAKFKVAKEEIKKISPTETIKGREADPTLRRRKSGVATFDAYTIDKSGKKTLNSIPVINIGVEDQIARKQFMIELPGVFNLQFDKIKELSSPDMQKQSAVESLAKMKFEKYEPEQKFEKIALSFPKDITAEKVKAVVLGIVPTFDVIELAYTAISPEELQLIQGLILTEYKDRCHLGTGLLHPLKNFTGEAKDLRDYYYASCLYKMGFYTDGVAELLKIVKQNNKFTKLSAELLVSDYKREFVPEMTQELQQVSSANIPTKEASQFHYVIALGESINKSWKSSLQHAVKVDEKSKKYVEAQYLASVAEYMLGDVKSSMERQERLLRIIEDRKTHPHVMSLLKMNMGRAAYRNKQYKKAIESYHFIGKDNPLWFQALIEQGWMQILSGDAPGAVGNMFSIQMPQFKDLYKPESYAVRAIGYLNICQYGDAKKTLDHLTKIYQPWISAMKKELSKQQFNYVLYNNVIASLKTGEQKTDLPQPILREIARHKDFLNVQEAINNKVDEEAQYPFIRGIAEKDRTTSRGKQQAAEKRAKDLDHKIKIASSEKDTLKFVNQWKTERSFENDVAEYYTYEGRVIEDSIGKFKVFSLQSLAGLRDSKEDLKSTAGKIMKTRLTDMQKKLSKLIENNEFLTYEVYSGSGESIRYVSAGGNVKGTSSTRQTASKSNSGKLYLWDFDGEYWADEIGNYKSSLKDNCPNANSLQKVQ